MTKEILTALTPDELRGMLAEVVKKAVKELMPKKEKEYLTRDEVCTLLKISKPTLHSYINKGKIKALKICGKTLFDADEIHKAVEERRVLRYGR